MSDRSLGMAAYLPARFAMFLALSVALPALVGCASAPAQLAPAPTPAPTAVLPTLPPPTATPIVSPTAAPTAPIPATPPPIAELPSPTAEPPTATPLPGESYIVYPRLDGSLWRMSVASATPFKLADPTEPGALPPWAVAPNGRLAAVVTGVGVWDRPSDQPPELALWLVGADGSSPRKIQDLLPPRGVDRTPGGDDAFNLLPALTAHQQLAWSPDGGLVAFVSAHENQVDLYTATVDGAITRLTNTLAIEQGPRWSPDGTKVAYRTTTGFGAGAGWSDVGLGVATRGGEPLAQMDERALAEGRGIAAIPDLLWIGPDSLIAGLWSGAFGRDEVRAITVSSGTAAAIFGEPYSALGWSAATGQLAIAGASESMLESQKNRAFAPGLYIWMPGAGDPIRVVAGPVEALSWSPQGDALAYSMARSGQRPGVTIWSLLMDGDLKQIAATPAQHLRWSLDGQRLAADTAIYGRDGRKLAELDSREPLPAGWGSQGLYYFSLGDDGQSRELRLWDGAHSQLLDTGVGRPEGAAVVVPK